LILIINLVNKLEKKREEDFKIEFHRPKEKNQYPLMLVSQRSSIVVKIRRNLLLSLPVCSLPEDNGGAMISRGLTRGARTVCINSRR